MTATQTPDQDQSNQGLGEAMKWALLAAPVALATTAADATIIHVDGLSINGGATLDLTQGGTFTGGGTAANLLVSGTAVNNVSSFLQMFGQAQYGSSGRFAYRASSGNTTPRVLINPSFNFFASLSNYAYGAIEGSDNYVGFRLTAAMDEDINGTDIHYGWFQLDMDANHNLTLISFAIEDAANTAIRVSDTGQNQNTVPEPNTLSLLLLAAGAGGVSRYRRRRQAAA